MFCATLTLVGTSHAFYLLSLTFAPMLSTVDRLQTSNASNVKYLRGMAYGPDSLQIVYAQSILHGSRYWFYTPLSQTLDA
jgi:hypothetical protein